MSGPARRLDSVQGARLVGTWAVAPSIKPTGCVGEALQIGVSEPFVMAVATDTEGATVVPSSRTLSGWLAFL